MCTQNATTQLKAAIADKNQATAAKALDHLLQAMKARDTLDVVHDTFELTSAAGMILLDFLICYIMRAFTHLLVIALLQTIDEMNREDMQLDTRRLQRKSEIIRLTL